ncbi:HlyD family secretion protein [Rhizobium sp. NZLR1]|uniref:HlyD family secretion protein n=1 Tax=Rhizobium sp. NZLR1 TaxID=2731096 RepID=UPI001A997106|nr:HlyD family secretion protein [Rhizobium sp. NZLR1]MBX5204057.1 HlyD family secretion protein [Rhizobium sp. NZLR1]QSZ25146.1 HlyD family secretion protein [Rhizobium sp. NZLR1]
MRIPGPFLIAVALAASAGFYVYFNRAESSSATQSTDDAYVQADFTNVASRIGGVVSKVLVEENKLVSAGDTVVVLDDRDLRIALQNAEAALTAGEASTRTTEAQIRQQGAIIAQASAKVEADDAMLALAQTNELRAKSLIENNATAQQGYDKAVADLATAVATHASDVAALDAAKAQIDILNSQLEGSHAALAQARTKLADARLQLSYATITAPISGTVGQKSVRTGAYIGVGTSLLSIVPLDQIYVRANFRETQLARVRSGQSVIITVDALPNLEFKGAVDSIGPASGSTYSAVASQNATGNFTKIAQRLPVRIHLEPGQKGADSLRVGMSVVPEIRVD